MLPHRAFALALLAFAFVSRGVATTYFVASNGDDQNDGATMERPWKSAARVSSFRYQPGDKILFKAGETFDGSILLSTEDSGTAAQPIEIGSFGQGRAVIRSGLEAGLHAKDVGHLVVQNLVLIGSGPTTNREHGILIENTSQERRLGGPTLDGIEVKGFGKHGMMVTGDRFGFENVAIRRCSFAENLRGGLEVAGKLAWDAKEYAHKNVLVSECVAFDNPGDPNYTKNHSGSGLVLYQVDGGRIEKCAAWNNGAFCPAAGGGPVGIWTCASRNVTIEYCESFGNRTRGLDGGGFDIDGGSEGCVLQYNYSHDNQGPGLMVYTYAYASHADRGNVVRFNISVNDAIQSQRYAGIWIQADGRGMENLEVYNNTVMTTGAQAAFVNATGVKAAALRNNILVSGPNGVPLRVENIGSDSGLRLEQNLYWRGGAPFLVRWGAQSFESLEVFRTTAKQEMLGEEKLGAFFDPGFALGTANPGRTLPNLRVLGQFKPSGETSRIQGRRLETLVQLPVLDFLGNELKPGGSVPLGAISGS